MIVNFSYVLSSTPACRFDDLQCLTNLLATCMMDEHVKMCLLMFNLKIARGQDQFIWIVW